ncbi:hypothetical protein [Sphingomicrobium aestuariivivum]|uniref:hypothetical protein n=1 Tax=Sphingomicrobium aestuariivivum TaxID=1582356 RepID=UPI001FD6A450|nr:hypothetical protein [Sphingomicrobium aestuariivivum]MCJ8190454.1 hypothetical protein [Sphingomicrobium aestuariivivum]
MLLTTLAAALALQPAPPPPPPTPKVEAAEEGQKRVVRREVRRWVDENGEVMEEEVETEVTVEEGTPECATRAFAADAETVGEDGEKRVSRIVLCADSDDPATYRTMLESAKEQIGKTDQLSAESREELLGAIDEEIASLDAE